MITDPWRSRVVVLVWFLEGYADGMTGLLFDCTFGTQSHLICFTSTWKKLWKKTPETFGKHQKTLGKHQKTLGKKQNLQENPSLSPPSHLLRSFPLAQRQLLRLRPRLLAFRRAGRPLPARLGARRRGAGGPAAAGGAGVCGLG